MHMYTALTMEVGRWVQKWHLPPPSHPTPSPLATQWVWPPGDAHAPYYTILKLIVSLALLKRKTSIGAACTRGTRLETQQRCESTYSFFSTSPTVNFTELLFSPWDPMLVSGTDRKRPVKSGPTGLTWPTLSLAEQEHRKNKQNLAKPSKT